MLILRTSGSNFGSTYINVKDYGAVGDDVTNDRNAFLAAVTAAGVGGIIYVPKGNYYLNGAINTAAGRDEINLLEGQTIFGDGNSSVLRTSTNTRIIGLRNHAATVGSHYVKIHSLKFKGSGKNAGHAFQTGISCTLGNYFDIYNCTFEDISGTPAQNGGGGIYLTNIATGSSDGGRIGLNYYKNCNGGLVFASRSEYVTVMGGSAGGCNTGLCIGSGNIYVSGFVAHNNAIGYDIISGTNDGHGSIVGGSANHNTTYNLRIKDVENGFVFSGTQFYQGHILVDNTLATNFIGCHVVAGSGGDYNMTIQNGAYAHFVGCRLPKSPTVGYLNIQVLTGGIFSDANNVDQ